jgi:hypothetical protein
MALTALMVPTEELFLWTSVQRHPRHEQLVLQFSTGFVTLE